MLSAGQDTNCRKHKLFDLVTNFEKGGCSDVAGEEQPVPPLPPRQDMTDDNHTQPAVENIQGTLSCHRGEAPSTPGPPYMLRVYKAHIAVCGLNSRARIWLPANLHFKEYSSANVLMMDYLTFGSLLHMRDQC